MTMLSQERACPFYVPNPNGTPFISSEFCMTETVG